MAIREDLVSSAVTFLQDPSVASAPTDKKIAFLQSKNLTQEEIDAALARVGDRSSTQPEQVTVQTNYTPQSQQVIRQPPPPSSQQYEYNGHPGYWQQPPPEVPRSDWRDYFIMATVMSGVGYGLYFIAKVHFLSLVPGRLQLTHLHQRYIYPIIAPPTPPQLEQDKAAVDESFNRAFNLIEQLSNDTAVIKESEEQRTEKLDAALADFERTVSELKEASRKRDDDTRRLGDDVRGLQDLVPRAIKAQEKSADDRLKDLGQELKSLKTLLNNRVSGSHSTSSRPTSALSGAANTTSQPAPQTNGHVGGESPSTASEQNSESPNPLGRFTSGKGGIPSWQMAASKASQGHGGKSDTAVDNAGDGTHNNVS